MKKITIEQEKENYPWAPGTIVISNSGQIVMVSNQEPRAGRAGSEDTLFAGIKIGDTRGSDTHWMVGDHSDSWIVENYRLFKGKITLEA